MFSTLKNDVLIKSYVSQDHNLERAINFICEHPNDGGVSPPNYASEEEETKTGYKIHVEAHQINSDSEEEIIGSTKPEGLEKIIPAGTGLEKIDDKPLKINPKYLVKDESKKYEDR